MEDLKSIYIRLKKEYDELPQGYISKKTINGKIQYYLQWRENGKMKSKYIRSDALAETEQKIARRKELEPDIKRLQAMFPERSGEVKYNTHVMTCDMMQEKIEQAKKFKKRDCYERFLKCLYSDDTSRVTALYGLRRTGKTTMIYQALGDMSDELQQKAVYIKLMQSDNIGELTDDLYALKKEGYKYIFIDEVTLAEDFIDNASVFSDVFAAMGMHIVLSGTDSLGFRLAEENELYDRVRTIHTTFIPYREYSRLLGINSLDEYIRYGGTLRAGEIDFDDEELNTEEASFRDDESTRRYSDTAIARNIQHSLACFENGNNFRHLYALYDANELTNAINRVVEEMNHKFVLEVLTRDFKSSMLGMTAKNLRNDQNLEKRTNILDKVDRETITGRLMDILEIRNAEDRAIGIKEEHVIEIKEYLELLDLIVKCPIAYGNPKLPETENVLFSQPGMRYCQAQALVYSLTKDEIFRLLSDKNKEAVAERILEEVRGRMMEDIILLETLKVAGKQYQVFKLQFTAGEYDMVIRDKKNNCCALYEVKHTANAYDDQPKHMRDEDKLAYVREIYGDIVGRYILYRGENFNTEDGIAYRNAEEFLKNLPAITLDSGNEEIPTEDEDQGFCPMM